MGPHLGPEQPTIPPDAWDDTSPWPDKPPGIAVTRLRLLGPDLLATSEASRVPLPRSVAGARPKRLVDYVAGRLCAERVLSRIGSGGMPGRRDSGVADWPAGFIGSISHTAGLAAAAAANEAAYQSLGIDVEQLMPASRANDLIDIVLTEGERARFAHFPLDQLVVLAFSAKEALFKALYPLTECRFYHEDAELVRVSADGTAAVRLRRRLSSDWIEGSDLPVLWYGGNDYCQCLTWVER